MRNPGGNFRARAMMNMMQAQQFYFGTTPQ